MYQKFLIRDTDRFDPVFFPKLDASLEELATLLSGEPSGPKTGMVLSYVKGQSISPLWTKDHPQLAALISSGSLPLNGMKDLFASSKNNLLFWKELEAYIETYLNTAFAGE